MKDLSQHIVKKTSIGSKARAKFKDNGIINGNVNGKIDNKLEKKPKQCSSKEEMDKNTTDYADNSTEVMGGLGNSHGTAATPIPMPVKPKVPTLCCVWRSSRKSFIIFLCLSWHNWRLSAMHGIMRPVFIVMGICPRQHREHGPNRYDRRQGAGQDGVGLPPFDVRVRPVFVCHKWRRRPYFISASCPCSHYAHQFSTITIFAFFIHLCHVLSLTAPLPFLPLFFCHTSFHLCFRHSLCFLLPPIPPPFHLHSLLIPPLPSHPRSQLHRAVVQCLPTPAPVRDL